jgi:hypothetical protein
LTTLLSADLVQKDKHGYYSNTFKNRQFESDDNYSRVKRYRKRKRNVSETVNETAPDTDTDTDTETYKEKEIKKKKNAAEAAPTPAQITRNFFKMFYNGHRDDSFKTYAKLFVSESICRNFCDYWTEKSKSGKNQKWELEKTFELPLRIATWNKNLDRWNK